MLTSLYCTADKIGIETGGGAVTNNELEALKSVSEVGLVLDQDSIIPTRFQQPDSPFLFDYFALEQIWDKHFDIAHFYSGTFTLTVKHLKERGTKVSFTVPAHDREISLAEFLNLGLAYPFAHIRDDNLYHIFCEGYRLADVVIAPSISSAEYLRLQGCPNVIVIPHGMNQPRKVKPIPEKFDVGYLGVVGPDKGLPYLMQAWSKLNYPESRLILAGSGTDTLEPFVRYFAAQGEFVLLGRIPDVADFYNSISVYVQPSVTEGFGLEIPEAMSYGRPVITTEGTGGKDCIEEGKTGFIVPIRDLEAIAEKIDFFKKNPDKLREMGQSAKIKARNYTWDKIRKKYARVFSSL